MIMIRLKEILIAIFCLGILYSATVNYGTFKLYNLYGAEHAYVQTDAKLTNDVIFSSTPKVLGTNKYCPGNFKITADIEGKWLVTSGSFEAVSDYPPGTDASCVPLTASSNPTKCPDLPISYSNVNTNKNLEWLTNTEYSAVYPTDAYFTSQPSQLSVFYDEKITKYLYGGQDSYQEFKNKKGGVNLFCKGSVSLKLNNNLLNTQQIASATSYTKNIDVGTYSIKSELSGVECFSAIKKYPNNDGFFRIYVMKKWTPNLAGTADTYSFTVADPELDFKASKTYPLDSQLQMEPNQNKDVFFNIKNSGDVKIKVTDVSAGAGTTSGFTVNEAPGTVFYPLQAGNIQNGFNKEISPGQSKIVAVRIHSPSNIPSNSQVKIRFQITATEKTCAEASGGANINAEGFEFEWFDFNFPIIPLPVLKSCEFVPTTQTVEIGDIANYILYCYDQLIASPTKTKINCLDNGMEITTNPQSIALLAQSPTQSSGPKTNVKIEAIGKGSATITADNNLPNPVICSATIQSNEQALPIPDACSLQKSNAFSSNVIGLYSAFIMTCFKNGQQINCPKNTSTLNIGVTNGIASYYAYSALNTEESLLSVKNLKYGLGMVTVSEKTGKYFCSALLNLTPSSLSYCSLSPANVQTEIGKQEQFNITCNEVGVNVPCKNVVWSTSGVSATIGTKDNSKAQVTFGATGAGVVTASAVGTNGLPLNYNCSASAQIYAAARKTCEINPDNYEGYIGSRGNFSVMCYENQNTKMEKKVPCGEIKWNAYMKGTAIPVLFQNNSNAIIRFTKIGQVGIVASTHEFTCTVDAFISAPPTQKDLGDKCEITVIEEITYGDSFTADITCMNSTSGKIFPCENVTWGLEDGHGTIDGDDNIATCTLSGEDTIVATIDGEVHYVCKLSLSEKLGKKCVISPTYWIAKPGEKRDFAVKCENTDCDSIDWGNSYTEYLTLALPPDAFGNKSLVTATVAKDLDRKVEDAVIYVNAEYLDEEYYCEADVYIGALMCVDYI